MNKVYPDATTGEWVGEYETQDQNTGEITRRTEWFSTREAAKYFSRTGKL